MAVSVSNVYLHVAENVINSLRPDFQSDGVDDSVLNEVQALWELKMMQNGAIQCPIDRTSNSAPRGGNAAITPVHDLNVPYEATEEYETPTAEMLFPPTPLQTPIQTPLPGVVEPVVYQYFPPGPSESVAYPDPGMDGDVKIGRPAPYMQPPAAWMSQKPLGVDVNIAYEEGREEDETGAIQMPVTKDFFTLSAGKRKRDDHTSNYLSRDYISQQDGRRKRDDHTSNYLSGGDIPQQDGAGDFSLELAQSSMAMCHAGFGNEMISKEHPTNKLMTQERNISDSEIAAVVKSKYSVLKIPQVDGVNDNLDNTMEDYNVPTEQEQHTSNNSVTPKAIEDEEPPLNEEDDLDDLDDLDQADKAPETDDLILAQFEKVSRTKGRWKCTLKDGIMHLNDKDHLFSKATGELQFC